MQSIFGLQLSQPLVYFAAIAVILLLLAVFAWVLRKISGNNAQLEGSTRSRQPRLGIVDTSELSFAPEPAPIYPTVPVASLEVSPPITAPNPADLAEIANRLQTSTAKPIVAEREATMPQATPIPFMPRPAPAPLPKEPEPVAVESPPESQPIIPAIERALPRVEMAEKSPEPFTQPIQSRDIGSLNDTLRQLLGRTRES